MNFKLTLSINHTVIEKAKKYAKSSGKTLSNVVEEYLKSLTSTERNVGKEVSTGLVKELRGAVSMPKDFTSYKETLQDALIDKYIKK